MPVRFLFINQYNSLKNANKAVYITSVLKAEVFCLYNIYGLARMSSNSSGEDMTASASPSSFTNNYLTQITQIKNTDYADFGAGMEVLSSGEEKLTVVRPASLRQIKNTDYADFGAGMEVLSSGEEKLTVVRPASLTNNYSLITNNSLYRAGTDVLTILRGKIVGFVSRPVSFAGNYRLSAINYLFGAGMEVLSSGEEKLTVVRPASLRQIKNTDYVDRESEKIN